MTPFGNSAEWAEAGSLKTLYPPQASTTYILASYVFKQWRNYGGGPSLTIRVENPITIIAEYTLQPDYTSLSILSAAVTAIALASLLSRRKGREL